MPSPAFCKTWAKSSSPINARKRVAQHGNAARLLSNGNTSTSHTKSSAIAHKEGPLLSLSGPCALPACSEDCSTKRTKRKAREKKKSKVNSSGRSHLSHHNVEAGFCSSSVQQHQLLSSTKPSCNLCNGRPGRVFIEKTASKKKISQHWPMAPFHRSSKRTAFVLCSCLTAVCTQQKETREQEVVSERELGPYLLESDGLSSSPDTTLDTVHSL